jgi:galactosamine-6-phosphate isomerase
MKITYFDDYAKMSQQAAALLLADLQQKKDLLVCAATGGSPEGMYAEISTVFQQEPTLFADLRILKLDEWGGIPLSDPNSCHSYLETHVLNPLQIKAERYTAFNSEVDDLEVECRRIQSAIDQLGGIDVCVLGLGKNGHLGFNEPADFLHKDCHIAHLSPLTLQHNMTQTMSQTPTFGMTVGMQAILQAKKIILLITGTGKQAVAQTLLSGRISTQLPASLLWLHSGVECLIDHTCIL